MSPRLLLTKHLSTIVRNSSRGFASTAVRNADFDHAVSYYTFHVVPCPFSPTPWKSTRSGLRLKRNTRTDKPSIIGHWRRRSWPCHCTEACTKRWHIYDLNRTKPDGGHGDK
jgi:hypothetical protein